MKCLLTPLCGKFLWTVAIAVTMSGSLLIGAAATSVGTLQIGEATVEDDKVVVPVVLGGDLGNGVAALDFRLNYDPEVLRPVSAVPGEAALDANKRVMGNAVRPGEYIVVMMEMNKTTCAAGEVARIVMERLSGSDAENWDLQIVRPTLASLEGTVIESQALQPNPVVSDETNDQDARDTAETADTASQGTKAPDQAEPNVYAPNPGTPGMPLSMADRSASRADAGSGAPRGSRQRDREEAKAIAARLVATATEADRAREAIPTPGRPDDVRSDAEKGSPDKAPAPNNDRMTGRAKAQSVAPEPPTVATVTSGARKIEGDTRLASAAQTGSAQNQAGSPDARRPLRIATITAGVLIGLAGLWVVRKRLVD